MGVIAILLSHWLCAAVPLSLSAAQAEARAHAPEGAELEARVQGARLEAAAAARVFRNNPTLSGGIVPAALAPGSEDFAWNVGLSMTFDVSGSWSARSRSGAAASEKARFDQQDGLRALDEAVAIAAADLAFAQRAVVRRERIATLFGVAADAAHKSLAVGEGNQLEVDASDLDIAAARADIAIARGQLSGARARLCRLLSAKHCDGLAVEDPAPTVASISNVTPDALVQDDPRVKAAASELRAAEMERDALGREAWPALTLGIQFDSTHRDIPSRAFSGPAAAGLTAAWIDNDLGLSLSLPLPIFERRQSERARATTRVGIAAARLLLARVQISAELDSAHASLRAATEAYTSLAETTAIIAREFTLLDQGIRAGAIDAVSRALALRRLQEAEARLDAAIRDLRVAQAMWTRRAPL